MSKKKDTATNEYLEVELLKLVARGDEKGWTRAYDRVFALNAAEQRQVRTSLSRLSGLLDKAAFEWENMVYFDGREKAAENPPPLQVVA